jgi:HK97 family phage portal protein
MILSNLKNSLRSAVWRSLGFPAAWFDRVAPLDNGGAKPTLGQPYAQSVWVMRAIKKVALPISAVPLEFYDGDNEVEDPRLEAFWKKPAIGLSLPDFLEATTAWLKLNGEAFWIMGDSVSRPFADAAGYEPLIVARPDRMRAVKSAAGLEGWQYTDGDSQLHSLQKEQVVHLKYYNPYDEIRGLAEYKAAQTATEADYAAGEYAKNLMENNGDTGPIIAAKGGMLTDIQQQQIIAQLRMKRELALRGEFRAAFLTSDVTVENPTALTTDANFAAMRLGNRHEIFLAFGVPPSMADKMESYSVGSASDWYILIFETCIPTAVKIASGIEQVLLRQTGRALTAEFEFDEHPVMQRVRCERLDSMDKLWTKGMPIAEINEYLNLGLPEFNGWDVGYLPFSVAPVGGDGLPVTPEPQNDPALAEEENTDITEAIHALRGRARHSVRAGCDCCGLDLSALEIRAGDPPDVRRWKSLVARRRETIRAYQSRFSAVLMSARREVLARLESAAALLPLPAGEGRGEGERQPTSRAVAAEFMFNLDNFSRAFQVALRGVAANALQSAGDQLYAEIKKQDPWSLPPEKAIMFFQDRRNKLSGVPDDIYGRIRDTIQTGLTNGDPLRDIAKAVRGEFNDIGVKRGLTIAQTETAAAYGVARQDAMEQAGVQWKEWVTSGNSNVRAAHRLMNGTIIPIGEDFIVLNPETDETDEITHPADPAGEPWNVINCHCVEVASATGPEGEAEPAT